MSTVRAAGKVVKCRNGVKMRKRKVLKMMAVMQERNSEEVPKEFLETGRTGRRNAMPDILHQQGVEMTTADLPSRLSQLVTSDPDNPQPGPSKTPDETNKENPKEAPQEANAGR